MRPSIYLDYNATAPLAPEVRAAMDPWLGAVPTNPGAVHQYGQTARAAVEAARAEVAAFCGGGDVVFTSGGTEADNLAVSALLGWPPAGHLVVSAIEHPAVLEAAAALGACVDITSVDVDAEGRLNTDAVAAAIREDTRLVSVMAANNETGTLQPIVDIAARAAAHGVPMHTDAVQAAAWVDLATALAGAQLISLSGHKIGGPPGVGALVVRGAQQLRPGLHGGGQQQGRRPGTEPTALLVGLAAACRRVTDQREAQGRRIGELSRQLSARLVEATPDMRVTVPNADRLPNTVHVCFADCPADLLVARADLDGLAISAGSACASGVAHGSYVLAALGVPPAYQNGAVRLSMGYDTTEDDVAEAAAILSSAVAAVRAALPAGAPA
jgi:cysteine desulfurase